MCVVCVCAPEEAIALISAEKKCSRRPNANVAVIFFQVEADLGYPGGKAKIVHKESDIIMAFAINKVEAPVT